MLTHLLGAWSAIPPVAFHASSTLAAVSPRDKWCNVDVVDDELLVITMSDI